MTIVYILIGIFAVFCVRKAFLWVTFKNKYPILSDNLPDRILSVGDKVVIGKSELEYRGISTHNGLNYVFMPENSVNPVSYSEGDLHQLIDAIYGSYGLKWKKVKIQ